MTPSRAAPLIATLLLLTPLMPARADGDCRDQLPQDFLIRSSMLKARDGFAKAVARAIRYRTEQYGHVTGAPLYEKFNPVPVARNIVTTKFMGLEVALNRRILKPLGCVEREILARCDLPDALYRPRHLSGARYKNTYRGGELSNHLFGTALDVDPDRNPCCGCVPPWSDDPKCKRRAASPFDRAELPRCWVRAFERFGFYWLGWDQMQDTMHFEYLADPAQADSP